MFIPVPDPITSSWLTAVLHDARLLINGQVLRVSSQRTSAFNSRTLQLQLHYSDTAPPNLPTNLILKSNISTPWAIEAGAEEVKFYQVTTRLQPPPPGLVPCYAAEFDPVSGDSYLLLQDLSETHEPPITRDQQISIVNGVPSASNIERVIDALALHHAYWWNHSLLSSDKFSVGYWSRNAERFALYMQRRQTSWESLRAGEADWLPIEIRVLYDQVISHLQEHWERYLEPRFRRHTQLTLIHGDAYFANFLCPKQADGVTYLLDWQSPEVDICGYDLANLCATFWTSAQRHESLRERMILERYYLMLQTHGVTNYTWEDLITDYQTGLIYWLLVPVQDRYDGSAKAYWWPKMQCLVTAFRDWHCERLLGITKE